MTHLVDPYTAYLAAGTSYSRMSPPGDLGVTPVYATFDEDRRKLMAFVDTGLVYPGLEGKSGDPSLLRYFYRVRFGGEGKLYIRALVEDTEVARGYIIMSDDPYQMSTFRLPRGTAGYGLRLQLAGVAWWRYYYIDWEPVAEGGGA